MSCELISVSVKDLFYLTHQNGESSKKTDWHILTPKTDDNSWRFEELEFVLLSKSIEAELETSQQAVT